MSDGASSTAGRRPPAARARTARAVKPLEVLRRELVEAYGVAGLALQQFRPLTALVVVKQAESCADAWIAAAEAFPYVRRVLEAVGKGAIPFALVSAHLPVWVAFAVEAGQMPLEHPWAQQIKPEIEHVRRVLFRQEEERRRQAEAASVAVDSTPPE